MTTDPTPHGEQKHDHTIGNSDRYRKGLELAEAGRHQEALEYMQEQLRITPDDAQVLNDTGAVLHCLGRSDEAIDHILKARSVQDDSAEIVWNLAEAYLAIGRAGEAVKLFDDMDRIGVLNADVLNRTADIFLNQQNKGDAIEMLLRSLRIWPDQEMLGPMIEVIRSKRPKVAFFCDDRGKSSLDGIVGFVGERFQVHVAESHSEDKVSDLMNWSDISWFEQCGDLAAIGSKRAHVCKNIVRLGRCQGDEQWLRQIEWANVDVLVMVDGEFDRNALLGGMPKIEGRSVVVVPRGVNLERFDIVERQRGKNIAYLSEIRVEENPALVLQCMQKLHYIDSEYRLFFGGEFQNAAIERYIRHMVDALGLGGVVFFDGRPEDVRNWLRDKHYVVSTGLSEHYGTELLEAMACGLKPVIHNFPGADRIFPPEFLFNISEELCERICSERYEPETYRRFVQESYPLENQLREINRILTRLEAEIESQQDGGSACEGSQVQTAGDVKFSAESAIPAVNG